MRTIETGLKFVTYTVGTKASYARLTDEELEVLNRVAAKSDGKLIVTGVRRDRRRTVR